MSATTLKVYFSLPSGKQEIRRFTTNERQVLAALHRFLEETYSRHFSPPLRFVLQYDDGEDLCSVSSESELQEGLSLHASSGAGGALKLLAAFDTSPMQQQSVEPVSGLSTPMSSVGGPSLASLSGFPASPSASAGVRRVQEEPTPEPESDSEYERVGEEEAPATKAEPAAAAPSPKSSAPEPSPAPVEVTDEEDLANAVAASMTLSPSVEEDAAPENTQVSIEDVSFSSAPVASEPASASASASASSAPADDAPVIHHGITCDGCHQSPLIGTRFNCITCGPARGGFDLCQRCEESGDKHVHSHQFRVMTTPAERKCPAQATAQPAVDPMQVLQAAVQRVVGSLTQAAQAEEAGAGSESSGAQPIQVIQESVGEVLTAFRQAGQARRAAWQERQAAREAEEQARIAAGGPVIHHGVTCDGCGQSPIQGVRYKCKSCTAPGGFDLCSSCEDAGFTKGEHTDAHVLIKFKKEAEGRGCWRRGGGRGGFHGHHGPFGHHGPHGHGPFGGFGPHGHPHGHHGMGGPMGHMGPLGALGPLGGMLGDLFGGRGGHRGGHGGWGWRGRCQRGGEDRPRAEFISDVTLADGLSVRPGEVLTKVWSVKNVGKAAWPVGTRLVFVGGDLAPESEGLWGPDNTGALVPYAGPGDVVHVSIEVQVPNEVGRFRCTFRLQTADGDRFGPRVWIDLRVLEVNESPAAKAEPAVPSPAAAAPAPTPVALPVASPVQTRAPVAPVVVPVSASAIPASKPVDAKAEEAAVAAEFRAAHVSPKPAAAAAAPAQPARPAFQYANELAYLQAMGFTDKALCKYLLLNNQGDLTKAVQWLLQNAKSA